MSNTGGSRESESVLVALRSVLHPGQFLIGDLRWLAFRGYNDVPRICLFHHFGLDKRIQTLLYVNLAVLRRWYRQGQIHEAVIRR